MQRLEVSGAVRPLCGLLGVKGLITSYTKWQNTDRTYCNAGKSVSLFLSVYAGIQTDPSDICLKAAMWLYQDINTRDELIKLLALTQLAFP